MNTATPINHRGYLPTIKQFLIPLLAHPTVARVIKYTVYASLVINFGFYVWDDYHAFKAALPPDAPLWDILVQFSTSIDMVAWLALVFLFELETYALPNEAFTRFVTSFLVTARVICYGLIGYAAVGYTEGALDYFETQTVPEVRNICELADQEIWLQVRSVDYIEVTSENCETLSDDSEFRSIEGDVAVIPSSMIPHLKFMGIIDIINAIVWILVVLLIEVEVWMQSTDRFSSPILRAVRVVKTAFYLALIGNCVIWAFTSYWLYAWDAFLWIFGFWAIELNLAEWEQNRKRELEAGMG